MTLRLKVDDPLLDENVCDLVLHFRRVAHTATDPLQELGGNFFSQADFSSVAQITERSERDDAGL